MATIPSASPLVQLGRWTGVVLYSAALALLCLAPSDTFGDTPSLFPHVDKVGHAAAFGVLTLLLLRARPAATSALALLSAATITTAYGVLLEFLQPRIWTQTRTFSMSDIGADALGAALACCLTSYFASVKLRHAQGGEELSATD